MIASVGLFFRELLRPGDTGPHGGYWFWSGIGSDLGEVTLLGFAAAWWHHHNCHEKRCYKIGHPDETGKVVCKKHHPRRHDVRG